MQREYLDGDDSGADDDVLEDVPDACTSDRARQR